MSKFEQISTQLVCKILGFSFIHVGFSKHHITLHSLPLNSPLHHTPLAHFTKPLGLLPKPLRLQAKSLAQQPKTLGSEPNRLAPEPKILTL